MKQHIVLKHLIENNQWIANTQDQLFTDKHYLLKRQITFQIQEGRPTSLQQLGYLYKDEPEMLNLIKAIHKAATIDRALFIQLRDELRHEAKYRIINSLETQTIDDPKQYKQLLKDLNSLELDEQPEELEPPVNFTDWAKHIAEAHQYLDSGIEPLLDTGTDTKVGDVFNILAASGNFKTGLMTNITKHQLYQGRNVLFYSMEESTQSFLARVGMGLLNLTPHQYSQLGPEEIRDRFSAMKLGQLDVISGKMIYIEDLAEEIKQLEEERGYKYDFIIPDYSAMIEVKGASKQAREDQLISKIFRELKLIAQNQNKIVVTAIQSNRDGYGKKKSPDVENTSASMGGVHVADIMVSLKYVPNPEAPTRPTPEDEQPEDIKGFVKLTVRKKRTGTVKVGDHFFFAHKANGNMIYQVSDEETQAHWDNLFDNDTYTNIGI